MTKKTSGSEIEQLLADRDLAKRYMDIADVIFLLLDANGNVKIINNRGCSIMGHNHRDIVGKNWFKNYVPEHEVTKVISIFEKIIEGKQAPVEFFENHVITKSGNLKLIAWHNSRLLGSSGNLIGTISSGIDITNQRLAEKRFKQIIDLSPNGIMMTNNKGIITLVNRQIEELFGYTREELLGSPIELLIPDNMHNKHKKYRNDYFTDPIPRPMGMGRDLYAQKKNGTVFPVEIGLCIVEAETGNSVLSTVVDISRRKSSEAILKENEEKLQAVLNNISDAILVYNNDGNIVMINNQAKALFCPQAKMIKNISETMTSDQIAVHNQQVEIVAEGKNILDYETERLTAGGKRLLVSISLTYMPSENGMYVETVRDITDRVMMRNKILDFEKAQVIANMAEGIAHHMGTPLASMLLRVQMLKEDLEEHGINNTFYEKMEFIEKQIHYCQKVMLTLLKFANKPSNTKIDINLSDIANDAIEILKPMLSKKSIKMVVDIDSDYFIMADRNLLQLVLSDLMINSIQSIDMAGIIQISAHKDKKYDKIIICISDDGSGIPEDVIPYVFEPFYTTKTEEKGTGLGLAVAKRVIQEHDGQIRIESIVGKGTDIYITIPAAKEKIYS